MGEVIQLQGDQRKDVQEFLVDKKEGLELDAKTIKVFVHLHPMRRTKSLMCSHRSTAFRPCSPRPGKRKHRRRHPDGPWEVFRRIKSILLLSFTGPGSTR